MASICTSWRSSGSRRSSRARSARRSSPVRAPRGLPGRHRRRRRRRPHVPAARCTAPARRSTPSPAPGSCRLCVTSKTTGKPELAHHREGPHVDDEVVVAEVTPRSVTKTFALPAAIDLGDRMSHVFRRQELSLLDVHRAAGLARPPPAGRSGARGTPESAERRRPRRRPRLVDLVNVGQQRAGRSRPSPWRARAVPRRARARGTNRATCDWLCRTTP